ncbi:MAG: DUF4352 domain-containing protein [bacterium]|nr:DUF4352 domain-containing protein [bacterium]
MGFLAFLGLIGFVVGLVGLFKGSVKRLKIRNRKAAAVVTLVGLLLLSSAGTGLPSESTVQQYLEDAQVALATGDLVGARAAAEKARSGARSKPDILAEAEAILREIVAAEALAKSAWAFETGQGALSSGHYAEAFKALQGVLPEDPNHADARVLLSQAAVKAVEAFCGTAEFQAARNLLTQAQDLGVVAADAAAQLGKEIDQAEAAEKKRLQAEALAAAKAQMAVLEGSGSCRIAVIGVRVTETFSDGFTTYNFENKTSWFVWVGVGVGNVGRSTSHVNPLFFSLIAPNGYLNEVSMHSWGISNSFSAKDLQPQTHATGWLLFEMPKAAQYRLVYESLDTKAEKVVVID